MSRRLLLGSMLLVLAAVALAPLFVHAQGFTGGIVPCAGAQGNGTLPPCTVCSLATLLQNLFNFAVYISVFIAAIFFLIAGIKFLSAAGGNDISQAKRLFRNVFIGLMLVMSAWLIVDSIMSLLVGGNLQWPWQQVCQQ